MLRNVLRRLNHSILKNNYEHHHNGNFTKHTYLVGAPYCDDITIMNHNTIADVSMNTFGYGRAIEPMNISTELIKSNGTSEALKLLNEQIPNDLLLYDLNSTAYKPRKAADDNFTD